MVVRLLRGQAVVFEEEVGIDYEPAVAVVDLEPGDYRAEVAQRICSANCNRGLGGSRGPEVNPCSIGFSIDDAPVELVARVALDECELVATGAA